MTHRCYELGGENLAYFAWERDAVGNKLFTHKLHDELASEYYTYDDAHRLTWWRQADWNAMNAPYYEMDWSLDPVGNWDSYTYYYAYDGQYGKRALDRSHDAANENGDWLAALACLSPLSQTGALLSDAGLQDPGDPDTVLETYFAYDADGNMTSAGSPENFQYYYRWDGFGRLSAVELNGSPVVYYCYDALNRRVVKYFPEGSEYGLPKVYVNDDRWRALEVYEADDWAQPAMECVDGAGIDEHVTIEADPSGPGAMIYYPLTDDLGSSARFIKHGSATPSAVINYDPYGRPQTPPTVEAPLFTGRTYDLETGFYYYRNRYYSPLMGRFISPDPASNLTGENLYEYVMSRPTVAIDPGGQLGVLSVSLGDASWRKNSPHRFESYFRTSYTFIERDPCCTEACWVQIARDRIEGGGWNPSSTGWVWWHDKPGKSDHAYCYMPSGHPDARCNPSGVFGVISMNDTPGSGKAGLLGRIRHYKGQYESCVVCVTGPAKGKTYACVKWGHDFRRLSPGWRMARWMVPGNPPNDLKVVPDGAPPVFGSAPLAYTGSSALTPSNDFVTELSKEGLKVFPVS